MVSLKKYFKSLIFKILCNPITGKIITFVFKSKIPNTRDKFKRYYTSLDYSNDTIRSMIFFGFYESAEFRLINNFLPEDSNVIELGSSLGIISSKIINKLNPSQRALFIEANPNLIHTIEKNLSKYSKIKNYQIINKAISYTSSSTITLNLSLNNTEVRIGTNSTETASTISVEACKLSSLELTKEKYTLVCDIEGSEIEILENDELGLVNCSNMIIELHETNMNEKRYSILDLVEKIKNLGFIQQHVDGNVFYFSKKTNHC
jgi:FkbM family methyltransferase